MQFSIFLFLPFLQSASEVSSHLPSFVINHGVVTPMEVQKLLNESMVWKSVTELNFNRYCNCLFVCCCWAGG